MKLSIRRKIAIAFLIFTLISTLIWSLSYYTHYLLAQKLQVIEKKDNLLNTILEARRYEKNYFLFFNVKDLQDSIDYVHQAEIQMKQIIKGHDRFTLSRNLGEQLDEIRQYQLSLSRLLNFYGPNADLREQGRSNVLFRNQQEKVRHFGKRVTFELESTIAKERQIVYRLVGQSEEYLYIALAGIFLLTLLTAMFVASYVNRPLKSIESAIHKIAHGDYTNIPEILTGDVFESLVTSLNEMIDELNRRSEQLVQVKKLASLGTLTSGVAHELNNPLNNISTSVQILLEELDEGDLKFQREMLQNTETQVDRARDIVKALLDFSRKGPFSPRRVSFRHLVSQTIALLKGEIPSRVAVEVDVPETIEGYLDPRRIQQVLINLITNGIHAMENGGTIQISAFIVNGNHEFCFQVSDTGTGIEAGQLGKIFDPFFTTKEVGQGSGLGLSISHGIVQQHGGRFEVVSRPGQGTTFSVYLPMAPRGEPPAAESG